MILEYVFRELELLLADLAFNGLQHVQPGVAEQLEQLKRQLTELNMSEGRERIDRLTAALQSGETDRMADEFCALVCYQTHLLADLTPSGSDPIFD